MAIDEKKIQRINELAAKAKSQGLTEAEREEQANLRREYVAAFRKNLQSQLDHLDIQNPDGSITHAKDLRKKQEVSEKLSESEEPETH